MQRRDAFTLQRIREIKQQHGAGAGLSPGPRRTALESPGHWVVDSRGLLLHDLAVYVPPSTAVRGELMKIHHDDPYAGHFGIEKTTDLLRRKYYWQGLPKDVKDYVETCDVCQHMKVPRHKPYGELASLPIPRRAWDSIAMDFIVGLPPSSRRGRAYDAILVIIDRYTKMARYFPTTSTIDAPDLAELFIDTILKDYGSPTSIITDRGSLFTSSYWSSFCYQLRIKRKLSTAFHPQTDGQTERQNQTLEHYLRCYCNYQQNDWAEWLSTAEFAYNNAVHSSTKITPFFALYGQHPRMPLDAEDDVPRGEANAADQRGTNPAADQRLERLREVRSQLEERLRDATTAQAKYHNRKHKPQTYAIGDKVLLAMKNLRTVRPSKKLDNRWVGPFEIEGVVGKQAYRLRLPRRYKSIHPTFHVSLLEPYRQRPGEEPLEPPGVMVDGHTEWVVERILDRRLQQGKVQYLVKWDGYPDSENTWEPAEHLEAAQQLDAYKVANPAAKKVPRRRNPGRRTRRR